MRPVPLLITGLLTLLLGAPSLVSAQDSSPPEPTVSTEGDFNGLVDIGGGRRLWLECRGAGSPTVILEAGTGNDADTWDAVGLAAGARQPAVLSGVAFTRVCAYDRPGTMLAPDHLSRSDPAPMPRTA